MEKKIKIIYMVVWIIASIFITLNIIYGFASEWMVTSINYLYVCTLICLFIDSSLFVERTNNTERLMNFERLDIWELLLLVIGISALLLFIGFKSSVIFVMAICTFLISIWILIKYRKQITTKLIINGLVLGSLSGIALYKYIPSLIIIFMFIPSFFISASILNTKFKITTININEHSYPKMIKSFFIGCFFALPMALSNLSDIILTQPYKWINQFWQPILAFNMVILEETWVRLFIITFIYALISSKTNKRFIPILTAIFISSALFGFSHYPQIDVQNCKNIMILYGFPMGVLFLKRDFETVIGYHFMINLIGAIAAYIINKGIVL